MILLVAFPPLWAFPRNGSAPYLLPESAERSRCELDEAESGDPDIIDDSEREDYGTRNHEKEPPVHGPLIGDIDSYSEYGNAQYNEKLRNAPYCLGDVSLIFEVETLLKKLLEIAFGFGHLIKALSTDLRAISPASDGMTTRVTFLLKMLEAYEHKNHRTVLCEDPKRHRVLPSAAGMGSACC